MKPTHPLPKLVRFEPAFWIPEPFQSLDAVIYSVYGLTLADGIAYPAILAYVQALNPTVFNTHAALGKKVVRLIHIQTRSLDDLVCSDPSKVIKQLQADFLPLNQIIQAIENDMPTNKKELESYRVMLGMLDYLGAANSLTGVGLGMLGNLAGTGLQREIQSQLDLLTRHKRGMIPQNTYKAQQAQSLKRICN